MYVDFYPQVKDMGEGPTELQKTRLFRSGEATNFRYGPSAGSAAFSFP